MFKRAFVLLPFVITASVLHYGQITAPARDEAFVSGSYQKFNEEDVRSLFDVFFTELIQRKGARGLVTIYGTMSDLASRKKLMVNHIRFRKMDPSLIDYRMVGGSEPSRTELWVLPPGSDEPRMERNAWIGMELGVVSRTRAVEKIKEFFAIAFSDDDLFTIIIFNYGSTVQMVQRERLVMDNIGRYPEFPTPRITFVRGGGVQKPSRFWIVPPGAAIPSS